MLAYRPDMKKPTYLVTYTFKLHYKWKLASKYEAIDSCAAFKMSKY